MPARTGAQEARLTRWIGEQLVAAVEAVGSVTVTTSRVAAAAVRMVTGRYGAGVRGLARRSFVEQVGWTAVDALPLVLALGVVVAVAAMGLGYPTMRAVGASALFGPLFQGLVMDEAAPLLVALLVIARSGTAIATELAAMRAGNEVDALVVHGVNPHLHLGLPRVAGVLVATLCLVVIFCASAYAGCALTAFAQGLPGREIGGLFVGGLTRRGVLRCLLKAGLFGALIPVVAVHTGLGGGRETTAAPRAASAVVLRALLPVLLLDGALTLAWHA